MCFWKYPCCSCVMCVWLGGQKRFDSMQTMSFSTSLHETTLCCDFIECWEFSDGPPPDAGVRRGLLNQSSNGLPRLPPHIPKRKQ